MGKKGSGLIAAVAILAINGLISIVTGAATASKEEDSDSVVAESDEEEDEEEVKPKPTIFKGMIDSIKTIIVDSIPIEAVHDLRPKIYMYIFGVLSIFAMAFCFLYYMYSVYTREVGQKFISLQSDAGVCETVVTELTGTYIADSNGNWIGQSDFSYGLSQYEMVLTGATFTQEEYEEVMLEAYDATQAIGLRGSTLDIAGNLIVLMSWQMTCNSTRSPVACSDFEGQSFVFSAMAQYIFDLAHIHSTFSNQHGDCTMSSVTNYDVANSLQRGSFDRDTFDTDDTCNSTVNPEHMGYSKYEISSQIDVKLDVRTFGDSVGLNSGFFPVTDLPIAEGLQAEVSFTLRNHSYTGDAYIDIIYEGMDPLFCFKNDNYVYVEGEEVSLLTPDGEGVYQICFQRLGGDVYGIPVFHHYGAGSGFTIPAENAPNPCFCDAHGATSSNCDTYDFISSMIFFDNHTATDAYTKVEQVILLMSMVIDNGGYDNFMRNVYNASFASAASIYGSDVDNIIFDPTWRENAYDFCNGNCSLFAVNSFGDSLKDHSISEYMKILDGGACEDVLSMPFEAFSNLVSSPPVDLSEKYYECNTAPEDAFNDAIGIASGNTATIVPIAFMVLLPFVYLWITISGGIAKNEYQREEKDDMQDKLILYLLRAKDGKVRSMKPNSPIVILANEIEHLSSQIGGYPDSDDSVSSDEEGSDFDSSSGNDSGNGARGLQMDTISNSTKSRETNRNMNKYAVTKGYDQEEVWI